MHEQFKNIKCVKFSFKKFLVFSALFTISYSLSCLGIILLLVHKSLNGLTPSYLWIS